jgi:metal-responsive CopG/Arc/MetJ family transcriptional regulator
MSQDLLELIDEMKGLASRSAFVEKLLRDQLEIKKKVTEMTPGSQ